MRSSELPLFDLFRRLRAADLPLGIADYQALLQALCGGYGVEDRDALRRLCRSLWAKSAEDVRLIDWHFDRAISMELTLRREDTARSFWNRIAALLTRFTRELVKWWRSLFANDPTALPAATREPAAQPLAAPLPLPLVIGKDGDEVQRAEQVVRSASYREPGSRRFLLRGDYHPLTRRQLQQSLRRLRALRREGPPVELDIQATITHWHRHGLLIAPVLIPQRRNRVELVILIDCNGSMVPFQALSARLVDVAQRGVRFRRVETYYFHNTPEDQFYRTRHLQDPVRLESLFADWATRQPAIAVVSDGGAARGGFRPTRIEDSVRFLTELRKNVRRVVWLNPMPRARWLRTTAAEIAAFVPMFEMSRADIDRAVEVLRGSTHDERRGTMRREGGQ